MRSNLARITATSVCKIALAPKPMHKNNENLRGGVVGAGNIVRPRHLPGLKKHPDVEIVAVSNSTYESAEKFCLENAPHATPMQTWADLISLPALDIVWIGTPPYMHSA